MSHSHHFNRAPIAIRVLIIAFAATVIGRADGTSSASSAGVISADNALGQTSDQIIGHEVRSTTGQKLGEVHDLVVDPSGRVVYALVSSGGVLGVGKIVRAVPFNAFTSTVAGPDKALAVDLSGADWNKAPLIRMDNLDSLAADQQGGEIYRYYSREWPKRGSFFSRRGADSSRLMLVSKIDGQTVMHNGQKVGEIDDVYVHEGRVLAVIDPADPRVRAAGKIVLGLDQLSWDSPTATVANTSLASADFAQAAPLPAGGVAVNSDRPYLWSPAAAHGRTLAPITDQSAQPVSAGGRASVAAVRRALHEDPGLASAMQHVQVSSDGEQLLLSGQVASEELKDRLAAKAKQVAQGWEVKNQLTVAHSVAE